MVTAGEPGPTPTGPQLFVFDLDDTLMDNFAVDLYSFNEVARRHGLPAMAETELLALRRAGALAAELMRGLAAPAGGGIVETLLDERQALLNDPRTWRRAPLKPGVAEALQDIAAMDGISVVLTRKQATLARAILHDKGIAGHVREVICDRAKGARLRDLHRQHDPSRMVFVSDSLDDLEQAGELELVETFCMASRYVDAAGVEGRFEVIRDLREVIRGRADGVEGT